MAASKTSMAPQEDPSASLDPSGFHSRVVTEHRFSTYITDMTLRRAGPYRTLQVSQSAWCVTAGLKPVIASLGPVACAVLQRTFYAAVLECWNFQSTLINAPQRDGVTWTGPFIGCTVSVIGKLENLSKSSQIINNS